MSDELAAPARRILDALPEPVLIVDRVGQVRYLNDAAGELLGYGRGELEGFDVATVIAAQPGQRIDVVAWFARWADDSSCRIDALCCLRCG